MVKKNERHLKGRVYGHNIKVDINTCFYCGCGIDDYSRTVDHLIPESRGGIRANKNKVPSCKKCNELKGDMNPEEFKRSLDLMIRHLVKSHKQELNYLKKIKINIINLIESKNANSNGRKQNKKAH